LILDAHGLPTPLRFDFVDKMIELAVHSAREDAIRFNVTPETEGGISETGVPVLGVRNIPWPGSRTRDR
jgi:hypothetical protein